jgi:hypothetical protein
MMGGKIPSSKERSAIQPQCIISIGREKPHFEKSSQIAAPCRTSPLHSLQAVPNIEIDWRRLEGYD